jgi:phosphoribosyl-dephospho-CoA transferase
MRALQRHQLLRLRDSAWQRLLADTAHLAARPALTLWARHGHPVVVSRQAPGLPADTPLAAGLPAPLSLGRARIALALRADEVLFADAFPLAPRCCPRWRRRSAPAGRPCARSWTRWRCRPASTAAMAGSSSPAWPMCAPAPTWTCCCPSAPRTGRRRGAGAGGRPAGLPRLDGELLWPDGAAVAWREWAAWRAGQVGALLVRRIDGVNLVEDWPCHSLQSA